jgi:hypothetical protein
VAGAVLDAGGIGVAGAVVEDVDEPVLVLFVLPVSVASLHAARARTPSTGRIKRIRICVSPYESCSPTPIVRMGSAIRDMQNAHTRTAPHEAEPSIISR